MLAAARHQTGLFRYICLFGAFLISFPEIKAYYLVPINQDIQLHQPIPSDEFQYLDDSDLFQLEEDLEENEENEMLYDVTEDLNIGRTAEPSQIELEDDDSSSQYGITEWYLPRRNKRSPQFGFGGGFGGGRFGGRHRRRHRHRHGGLFSGSGLGFGNGRGQGGLGALTNLAFGLALGGGRYGGGFGNGYGNGYGNGFYGK